MERELLLALSPNPGSAAGRSKSHTRDTGAGGKERGLSKCWSPGRMGGPCPKAHLTISVPAEVFMRRGRDEEQRDLGSRGRAHAGSALAGPNVGVLRGFSALEPAIGVLPSCIPGSEPWVLAGGCEVRLLLWFPRELRLLSCKVH